MLGRISRFATLTHIQVHFTLFIERTGFAAADFSRIRNADLSRFTIDRLINILGALDEKSEVHLNVRKRRKSTDAAQHPSL